MVLVNSVVATFRFSEFEFSLICCLVYSCVALPGFVLCSFRLLACLVCERLVKFWFEFGG